MRWTGLFLQCAPVVMDRLLPDNTSGINHLNSGFSEYTPHRCRRRGQDYRKNTLGRSIKSIFESSFGKPAPGVLSIQGLETGPRSNSYLLTFTNKATVCHLGSIGEVKCHSTRKHPEHLIMSLIRAAHEIRCCQAPETCIPCLQQDHVWWAAVRRR